MPVFRRPSVLSLVNRTFLIRDCGRFLRGLEVLVMKGSLFAPLYQDLMNPNHRIGATTRPQQPHESALNNHLLVCRIRTGIGLKGSGYI